MSEHFDGKGFYWDDHQQGCTARYDGISLGSVQLEHDRVHLFTFSRYGGISEIITQHAGCALSRQDAKNLWVTALRDYLLKSKQTLAELVEQEKARIRLEMSVDEEADDCYCNQRKTEGRKA